MSSSRISGSGLSKMSSGDTFLSFFTEGGKSQKFGFVRPLSLLYSLATSTSFLITHPTGTPHAIYPPVRTHLYNKNCHLLFFWVFRSESSIVGRYRRGIQRGRRERGGSLREEEGGDGELYCRDKGVNYRVTIFLNI
jgi:hypothetical protein